MQVPDQTMKNILATLPKGQRDTVLNTLESQQTHKVYCDSGVKGRCNKRLVGYMAERAGRKTFLASATMPKNSPWPGEYYVWAYRPRLDGNYGFVCHCGNDSRIAKQEQGIFDRKGTMPDKNGLNEVFSRIAQKPPNYPEKNGAQHIDGFTLEVI